MKSNSKFFKKNKSLPVDKFFQNVLYDKKDGYYATKLPVYVCYINEDTFKVFHKDNCETLQPESMMSRLESFKQKCKVRQNLLKISDNPKVIKDYIQPDFSHFFWKNDLDPDYLEDAKKFWQG